MRSTRCVGKIALLLITCAHFLTLVIVNQKPSVLASPNFIQVCGCMCVCVHVFMFVFVYACVCMHVYLCLYACVFVCVCMCVCLCLYASLCACVWDVHASADVSQQSAGCTPCLLSLAGAATSVILVAIKVLLRQTHVCCDKSMRRQNCRDKIMFVLTKYFCCDKTFVVTNICHDKHMFVAASILLSWQKTFCHNKRAFIAINISLSWQIFVMRKVLLQQKICLSCQKFFVVTTSILLSRQKTCFVTTNACLSRQKLYLWQLLPMIVSHQMASRKRLTNKPTRKFHKWNNTDSDNVHLQRWKTEWSWCSLRQQA